MNEIQRQLREAIGLDARSLGSDALPRAVRQRMKTLGLKRLGDYEALLAGSPAERAELIESVVVPETWFFRDPAAFAALVGLAHEQPRPAASPLRLLSLPCSSGEEPFSAVIALVQAGISVERFHIDAVDISARTLAEARTGVYGKNSFRGRDLAFRARHFRSAKEKYILDPAIRSAVHFEQGNLFSEDFIFNRAPYDFIFCRNLLIYFDPPTQQKALERLGRLLSPAGTLFVGPAEHPVALAHGFATAGIPMAFACHKLRRAPAHADGVQRPARHTQVRLGLPLANEVAATCPLPAANSDLVNESGALRTAAPYPLRPVPGRGDAPSPSNGKPTSTPGSCQSLPADLEQAQRFADAGRLAEAAALCEAHLSQSRHSAQAYYLLGLVREAGGNNGALECYRKALYLRPNHYETLLHMALLAEKNGDTAAARAFRRRAQRARAGADSPLPESHV
ncbi:MAG TPA: CheR family methyltransferase [Candidatus Binatia bacterium]|jgi:chemotaxis protein methyltransferase WspC|nr:CheR family methyltransferase [Candidatus Binatia bacterium]